MRIEVTDGDPAAPLAKRYDVDAASGRGLQLVEALSERFGTQHARRRQGGVVRGGVGAEPDDRARGAGYHIRGGTASPDEPVHLLAVPLEVLVELQLYFDDMVRELQLIAVGQADDRGGLPAPPPRDAHAARDRPRPQRPPRAGAGGLDAGRARSPTSSSTCARARWRPSRALIPLVDAFDEASRGGDLLTAPCTPSARRLLEWIVDEIEVQLVVGERTEALHERGQRLNVLYITVDQWRGDCLSALGHPVVRDADPRRARRRRACCSPTTGPTSRPAGRAGRPSTRACTRRTTGRC